METKSKPKDERSGADRPPRSAPVDSARNKGAAANKREVNPRATANDVPGEHQVVYIGAVHPSSRNPRKRFDPEALDELAESLKTHGMLEPLVVRPRPGEICGAIRDGGGYEILCGERRYRAALQAGLVNVPVIIRLATDEQALEITLIENLQRRDLDPIEEAAGYRALADLGYTQEQIAAKVHRAQPTIANRLRLLSLPDDVLERISQGALSPSHGVVLAGIQDVAPAVLSIIGEAAATLKISTHELEKGLPESVAKELVGARLARDISKAKFDWKAVCQSNCPFKAFKRGPYYGGWCLRPEHFRELQQAAEAQEQANLQEQAADLKAKGHAVADKIPRFNWQTMAEIGDSPPSDCTKKCPCRGAALGNYGKVEIVCTDRKRFLEKQETQRNKQRNCQTQAMVQRLEQVRARLADARTEEQQRALMALLVGTTLLHANTKLAIEIAHRYGLSEVAQKDISWNSGCGSSALTTWLSALPILEQLRLAVEFCANAEAHIAAGEYSNGKTPFCDRLLGLPAATETMGEEGEPSSSSSLHPACPACGLAPGECMCAEVQARHQSDEKDASGHFLPTTDCPYRCPLCGADDLGACPCDADAVNAALAARYGQKETDGQV